MTLLLVLITLAAAAMLFAVLIFGADVEHLRVFRLHHGYYGLILAGYALSHLGMWPAAPTWRAALWTVAIAGELLLIDDTYQHIRQRLSRDYGYRSPGHHLTELAYRIPGVRRLAAWIEDGA